MSGLTKTLAATAAAAGAILLGPTMLDHLRPHLPPTVLDWLPPSRAADRPWTACAPHTYTTELVSQDPLLIYVRGLVSASEAAAVMSVGAGLLAPSPVSRGGGADEAGSGARTSWSAPLPAGAPVVECVLARSRRFLGSLLADGRDDMGAPQMVRYTAGQKFDLHADWFARPRLADKDREAGRRRLYNRVATLFVVLQTNSSQGGETWFPFVKPIAGVARKEQEEEGNDGIKGEESSDEERPWREHEDGGLAFKPIPGNALFWVNLFPNGTGDERVVHAGLPIKDGVKTAMNIWPRTFFGPDA